MAAYKDGKTRENISHYTKWEAIYPDGIITAEFNQIYILATAATRATVWFVDLLPV